MIMLVPISPEVPKSRAPKWWPGLGMVLLLCLSFIEMEPLLKEDQRYLQMLTRYFFKGDTKLPSHFAQDYLSIRPLLRLAPCKAQWDLRRLLLANFLHGSATHLYFNIIGAFAA